MLERGSATGLRYGAVLGAALELFRTNGYRVTTTRALEARLDLTASSLCNAFVSKEALLLGAIHRYQSRITESLLGPLETSSNGLRAVERFFGDLGRWILHEGRRGCLLVNLMAEDGGQTQAIAKHVRAYRKRLRSAL